MSSTLICCLPAFPAGILDDAYAAKLSLACREPGNRALRVRIDNDGLASLEMPMNREATGERTLAAAAFHGCHRDDRLRHLPDSVEATQRSPRAVLGRNESITHSILPANCKTAYLCPKKGCASAVFDFSPRGRCINPTLTSGRALGPVTLSAIDWGERRGMEGSHG